MKKLICIALSAALALTLAASGGESEKIETGEALTETILDYNGNAVIVNHENPVSDRDVVTIARIYTCEITYWPEVGSNDAEIVLIDR